MKRKFLVCTYCLVLLMLVAKDAQSVGSGGFENASFSARSLAEANAVVAQADEPAAISYNPAGIVQLPGIQIQGGSSFISSITHYSSSSQSNTRSSGTINVIPTGYVTINPGKVFNDRLVFGIGSDSPFGISNKYDSNHEIVRFAGYTNWLKMFTIKPVMAIRFSDWL